MVISLPVPAQHPAVCSSLSLIWGGSLSLHLVQTYTPSETELSHAHTSHLTPSTIEGFSGHDQHFCSFIWRDRWLLHSLSIATYSHSPPPPIVLFTSICMYAEVPLQTKCLRCYVFLNSFSFSSPLCSGLGSTDCREYDHLLPSLPHYMYTHYVHTICTHTICT